MYLLKNTSAETWGKYRWIFLSIKIRPPTFPSSLAPMISYREGCLRSIWCQFTGTDSFLMPSVSCSFELKGLIRCRLMWLQFLTSLHLLPVSISRMKISQILQIISLCQSYQKISWSKQRCVCSVSLSICPLSFFNRLHWWN